MRILRIADVPANRLGGMSRTMFCTGDALVARGHQVDYWFSDTIAAGGPAPLRRFTVPLRVLASLRRRLRQGRGYDVVEIHEPAAAPYCWVRRRHPDWPPLVIFSYGLEERSHQAMLHYRRCQGLPVSLKHRYSPLTVVWQAQYAVRHADHVICSNAEDVRHLEQAGVPARRLTRHQSGVEPAFLEAGREGPDAPRSGILFLGSWLLRKGILDLVPAVTESLRRHPTLRFTVAGCGVGAERVLADFQPALRPRVRVEPVVEGNSRLIDLYREHAIFVLPSYFEGQPLVMIEAAALGLAILTTGVCGMADFVVDRQNGLTIPVGDLGALTERLAELVDDPALVRRLGDAARRHAAGYTWDRAAARIEQAYHQAVTQGIKAA